MGLQGWVSKLFVTYKKRAFTKHLSSSIYLRIARLIGLLLLLVAINTFSMMYLEGMSVGDSLWLSFTTLTTVGYGDFSASSGLGRLITVVTMFLLAITILSLLAAEIIEWRLIKAEKKRRGLWEWKNMNGHIQIINTPNIDTERYLMRLVNELHKTPDLEGLNIQLLTRKFPDGIPGELTELKLLHRTGRAEDSDTLKSINLEQAKYVVLLARDAHDSLSDSITFDILSQIIEINPDACVVVEAVVDSNRERFMKMGAMAVLRPLRAYPEVIARALSNPGTERVLEDLFEVHGDSLRRIPVNFNDVPWEDVVCKFMKLKIGTPLAYLGDSKLHTQPCFSSSCTGDAVIALVKQDTCIDHKQLDLAMNEKEVA